MGRLYSISLRKIVADGWTGLVDIEDSISGPCGPKKSNTECVLTVLYDLITMYSGERHAGAEHKDQQYGEQHTGVADGPAGMDIFI